MIEIAIGTAPGRLGAEVLFGSAIASDRNGTASPVASG